MAREERVARHRHLVLGDYDPKQREFIEFVLAQYNEQGVGELDQDKLPDLLELKYHAVSDAVAQLG